MDKEEVLLHLFDGLYIKVYNNGDIYTLDHIGIRRNGRKDNRKGKKLRPGLDKYGYHRVTFSYNNKRKSYYVHQLVAKAFIPNVENKPTVNHIDGCKTNNNVDNLEWATNKEQKEHAIRTGLCDKNIKALEKHNKEISRKVIFKGVKYNSVREANRKSGSDYRTIYRWGEFI